MFQTSNFLLRLTYLIFIFVTKNQFIFAIDYEPSISLAYYLDSSSKKSDISNLFIRGDVFKDFCDHVYDETTPGFNPKKVRPYDTVFVKTDHDHLGFYLSVYHSKIKCPYILVTHNSDHSIPGPYASNLDDPKIVVWFGQNVENYSHPKLIPIPIGIANKNWPHGNAETFLSAIDSKDKIERNILLYMNISLSSYPNERTKVYNLFKEKPFCFVSSPKSHAAYLQDLLASKFVLSPRGNGIDCHRTWEALLMGAYPIVRTSSLDPLYKDLPVVIVEDWEEIDEEFLEAKYKEMLLKKYDLKKIYAQYWLDLIDSYK